MFIGVLFRDVCTLQFSHCFVYEYESNDVDVEHMLYIIIHLYPCYYYQRLLDAVLVKLNCCVIEGYTVVDIFITAHSFRDVYNHTMFFLDVANTCIYAVYNVQYNAIKRSQHCWKNISMINQALKKKMFVSICW